MLILNNSVISAFCELKKLQLLKKIIYSIGDKAAVPTSVRAEIIYPEALEAICITSEEYSNKKWILLLDHKDLKKYASDRGIHEGEAAVLYLAEKQKATAVLDDFKAREIARKGNIKLTGTIGLLRIGYQECPISTKKELTQIIDKLKSLHFYIPRDAEEYLLQAKKQPSNSPRK